MSDWGSSGMAGVSLCELGSGGSGIAGPKKVGALG